jgi:hypothetical protein
MPLRVQFGLAEKIELEKKWPEGSSLLDLSTEKEIASRKFFVQAL